MTFDFDGKKVITRINDKLKRVQFLLDMQVLKDSNFYCPEDEGFLKGSGVLVSGGGVVEWNMPYADEQYHGLPNKSHDKNPNAQMKWFEAAKAEKLKDWEALANNEYNI